MVYFLSVRWLFKALLIITILGGTAQAAESAYFDVVFDLDWTLAYKSTPEQAALHPDQIFTFENEIYRLSPGTIGSLLKLHRTPGIRVSFNSGGSPERNDALLDFIYEKVNQGNRGDDYSPYKVLSARELLANPMAQPTDSFSTRFKKTLLTINSNLKMILLIDDIKNFLPADQLKSLLWTGTTYEDLLNFGQVDEKRLTLSPADQKYLPPSVNDYLNERYKIPRLVDMVLKAFQQSQTDPVGLIYSWSHDIAGKNLDLTSSLAAKNTGALFRCEHIFLP